MGRTLRALIVCLTLAAVLGAPAAASAAPATPATATRAEYAAAIDRAQVDIARSRPSIGSDDAARGLAARMRDDLGRIERVSDGGRTFDADADMVLSALDDLEAAAPAGRRRILSDLSAHLASLRAALGGTPGSVRSDPAALAELLDQREKVREPGDDWLGDRVREVLERVARWLASLNLGGGRMSPGARIVTWIVLAIPAAIALAILLRALRTARRRTQRAERAGRPGVTMGPVVEAAADLPDDPLAYADLLVSEGRLREAMRALYGGAALRLVEAGAIQRMRTRTNAELLRDVRRAASAAAVPLATLTTLFEAAWYGHIEPRPADLAEARGSYERIVRDASEPPAQAGDAA